jgi:heme exporter protein CcmD
MTDGWGYILACYGLVLAALVVIVVRSSQRGRKLARQVPEEQRRWM